MVEDCPGEVKGRQGQEINAHAVVGGAKEAAPALGLEGG